MSEERSRARRVMIVIHSLKIGGAETMVENLSHALKDRGIEVKIISLHCFESIVTERMLESGLDLVFLGKRNGIDLSVWRRLSKLIADFRPDVVHSHLPILHYVFPASRIAGVKGVVHTLHSIAEKETRSPALALINEILYRHHFVIPVALSKEIQKTICVRYGMNEEEVPIVHNGINRGAFSFDRDYQISDCANLLHVGRFVSVKNQRLLVEAVSTLIEKGRQIKLTLVGEGPDVDSIRCLVRGLGIEDYVCIPGPTGDVASHLRHSDIFLLVSDYDGISMSLAEAMASGVPIIVTPVGGVPDMVKSEESALFVDPNVASIASAIERLCDDERLRKSIGESARRRSAQFDRSAMAAGYERVYEKAIQAKS